MSRGRIVQGVAIHDRASLNSPNVAPRLVLLHGLAVSHRYLMPLAARLADHQPTHVVDLPDWAQQRPKQGAGRGRACRPCGGLAEDDQLLPVVVLGNSSGCQVAVDLAVRYPNCICGLILVDPTVDPAARTASRQILRWLRDTLQEDLLQLPILLRDVRDAGLRRVAGALAHAVREPIEGKLPLVTVPTLVTRGAKEPIVPMRGRRRPPGCSRMVNSPSSRPARTTPTTAPPTIRQSWCWCSCADKHCLVPVRGGIVRTHNFAADARR